MTPPLQHTAQGNLRDEGGNVVQAGSGRGNDADVAASWVFFVWIFPASFGSGRVVVSFQVAAITFQFLNIYFKPYHCHDISAKCSDSKLCHIYICIWISIRYIWVAAQILSHYIWVITFESQIDAALWVLFQSFFLNLQTSFFSRLFNNDARICWWRCRRFVCLCP